MGTIPVEKRVDIANIISIAVECVAAALYDHGVPCDEVKAELGLYRSIAASTGVGTGVTSKHVKTQPRPPKPTGRPASRTATTARPRLSGGLASYC